MSDAVCVDTLLRLVILAIVEKLPIRRPFVRALQQRVSEGLWKEKAEAETVRVNAAAAASAQQSDRSNAADGAAKP